MSAVLETDDDDRCQQRQTNAFLEADWLGAIGLIRLMSFMIFFVQCLHNCDGSLVFQSLGCVSSHLWCRLRPSPPS